VRAYGKKEKKRGGAGMKKTRKQAKQERKGGQKTREQGRKNPNDGEEEINKKRGFHQMRIKFLRFA